MGWMGPANPLPCLPSLGLQIHHLQTVHTQGRLYVLKEVTLFWFYFQIGLFQLFEHQSIWSNICLCWWQIHRCHLDITGAFQTAGLLDTSP